MHVPFTVEFTDEEEQEAVARAISSRSLIGNGGICKTVQGLIGEQFGCKHVLLTTSCTHALEMATLALGIGAGDEVILPSFTFVSTANCVVLRGATPVFADIRPDTLTIDPEDVRRKITPRTRAIIPVHYAGVGCDMDALQVIACEHGLFLIEDAAQGVDARYNGRYLGAIGDFGCYSFHGTKNIVCGEGGALLTNDDALSARASIIHEKGTNRAAFLRGAVDKYSWVAAGSSYVLSDLLAAVLEAQLRKRDTIRQLRAAIWHSYYRGLSQAAAQGLIVLPAIPRECDSNYHIFFLRLATPAARNAVLQGLNAAGVHATFHYVPLHSSPFGQELRPDQEPLPVTEHCSSTLIRLPIFPSMSAAQVEYVLDQTLKQLGLHVAVAREQRRPARTAAQAARM